MPRYNKARNPSCDNNVTGWAKFTGTVYAAPTRVAASVAGKTTGGQISVPTGTYAAGFSVGSAAAGAGQTWSYVLWVLTTTARTVVAQGSKLNGTAFVAGFGAGSTISVPANTWTQVRGTFTIPTGGTWNNLCIHLDFPSSVASTVTVAAVRMEQITDAALTFADGSTGGQWSWDGTAGSSTSTRSDTVAITVQGARAAATAQATTVAQRTAVSLLGVQAAVQAGTAAVAQRHPLSVRAARSITAATRPLLTQRHALSVRTARADPRIAAGGAVVPGTGYGEGGYGSTPYGGTTAPVEDGRVQLAQHTAITTRNLATTTTASSPTVVPNGLSMRNVRAATATTSPLLVQRQSVTVSAARAATRAPAVALAQAHPPLTIRPAASTAAASKPVLTQRHALVVRGATAGPTADRPLLAQRTALVVRDARASTSTERANLAQLTALAVRAARSVGPATRPLLTQRSVITLRGARSSSTATRSTPAFRLGTQVRVPAVAVVQTRSESLVLVERHGDVALRQRGGTAAVNTRGRITVRDRHGSVVETHP